MRLKLTLPLLSVMLLLTGCFRQAEDSFDTVGSQNSDEITITQVENGNTEVPTSSVIVIDPNATSVNAQSDDAADASATPRVISPPNDDTADDPAPTNTSLAIPTATVIVASATPTQGTFITPDINEQAVQPTATVPATSNSPALEPTPTAFGETVTLGDCDYEVQPGDNLFRISINNDVSLSELLSINNLTEASVIQPGQVLIIPNCEDADGNTSSAVETSEVEVIPTVFVLEDCDYEIQSGDSLFQIALENEVTLADLLAENELTENSVIQPGQIITFPNCVDEDTALEDIPVTTEVTQAAGATGNNNQTIHIVVAGDTMLTIARQYGVTVNSILQANTIPNPNSLTAGQQLIIPVPNN
ncbi:MAG: LysM peptidoglycan-binding domain-containing protein [Phototrophicaceae bacterium]